MNLEKGKVIFEKIPDKIDIHNYRAEFACVWYERLARLLESLAKNQKYYCKGDKKDKIYDKRAMMTVSKMLGHERVNVIASNYLWKKIE